VEKLTTGLLDRGNDECAIEEFVETLAGSFGNKNAAVAGAA
jgi:hypothetical protein